MTFYVVDLLQCPVDYFLGTWRPIVESSQFDSWAGKFLTAVEKDVTARKVLGHHEEMVRRQPPPRRPPAAIMHVPPTGDADR